ncbi:sugar isomerase domain-containing protein [Bombilactobacillus apium]|uniref:sugar isomerase domain-containing protein n=1 Tax=Bombilactobacillus apium TaxID=2675299 RepID=UPI002B4ACD93|nr:sugar isomerase domain-containing protein [Bombilactobacillus apium]
MLFVCPHGVGTSSLIQAQLQHLLPRDLKIQIISQANLAQQDLTAVILIISTVKLPVQAVPVAQSKGVQIIGLTNVSYSQAVASRHASGKRLFEIADLVLDNHGSIGDAACQLQGAPQKVGPTSTVIGAAILNNIVVEACQRLVQRSDGDAPVFYSTNLDGGDAQNQHLMQEYQGMIHYRF